MLNTTIHEMLCILYDSVGYFGKDPAGRRSVQNGRCIYVLPEPTGCKECAIGRLLMPDEKEFAKGRSGDVVDLVTYGRKMAVKLSIERFPMQFLMDLQDLHDEPLHWDQHHLTPRGLEKVREIGEAIEGGAYGYFPLRWPNPAKAPKLPFKPEVLD